MWVKEDNKIMTFNEFLISESIKPKYTDYGTDLINKDWKKLDNNFYVTAFNTHNELYLVVYREGYIGFYNGDLESFSNLSDINEFDDVLEDYSLKRTNTNQALSIFNNVFFIVTEAIKKFEPIDIKFDGNDKDLGGLYSSMVENKFFIKQINELGYTFEGRTGEGIRKFFKFTKITN